MRNTTVACFAVNSQHVMVAIYNCLSLDADLIMKATCLPCRAGRPLPPLFNWQPAELDSCSPEIQAILTSGGSRTAAGGAGTAAAADAVGGGPSTSLG